MNDMTAAIGHNKPPISIEVVSRHKDIFDRLEELAAADALVPAVIANDEDEGKAQDVVLACKKTVKTADAMYKLEKDPFDKAIKEIKATFAIPIEKVEKVAKTVTERLDIYKEKKAIEERRRREAEAQRQREEKERLEREAMEAERRRQEAERARREEEERAARAQAEKERAEREAREARERAERLKEEAVRLEKERKEREAREAEEAKIRALDAARERQKEAAELALIEEQRRRDREAHDKRMAKLKAEREAEEARAKESREVAAKALAERRAAEEAAALARREERQQAKVADATLDDAVRAERRADRLDDASKASEADLSRGRGEYGSVGSRATFWSCRIIDRDRISLEQLRPYINATAIDAAVTNFMRAHMPELGRGRDRDDLLKGVEFYQETTTRVA